MLKNYLKIAIRNLLKQKLFSFINILSLTVGLTCSILLYLYVQDELSYDQFNTNKDSIYRVVQVNNLPDGSLQYEGLSHAIAFGPTLVNDNPSIETAIRFFRPWPEGKYYVKQKENSFQDVVLYGDFELFDVFSFPLASGSIDKKNLNAVVISETAAQKYFGVEDPINKPLGIRIGNDYVDFTVSAVCKDIPSNSSVQFDVLLPFNHIATIGELKDWQTHWGFGAITTYVKLKDGTDPLSLSESMAKTMATYYPNYAETAKERGYESTEAYRHYKLESLNDIHFNAKVTQGLVPSSDPMYSYVLMILVVGILAIACINFMNLSISRSANRIKEVGLRKTVGAVKGQLITQFLGESVLLSIFAFGISFLLVDLLLPVFNFLTDKNIAVSSMFSLQFISGMIGVSLLVGIIAGVYPAFVLSKFNIRDTLSKVNSFGGSNAFTKVLVTFQFGLSIILIIGMIVMSRQVNFLKNKDLGFNTDNVLVLKNSKVGETYIFSHLKNALANQSSITGMTSASQTFADPSGLGGRGFSYKGEEKRVGMITVTEGYLETLGIKLKDGRNFNSSMSSDFDKSVIINESCMKDFELTLNETFQEITRSPDTDPTVIGVMGDFNYETLKIGVLPMLIKFTDELVLDNIFIKTSGGNTTEVLALLKKEWEVVAPDLPFEYTFLDETMKVQYMAEEKWGSIISYAMAIAIALSCLGLFGLVALGLESRKKEIGVRKVLGAEVKQIVWLFTSKYLRLVIVAFIIAVPISYYLVQEWLLSFTYRIDVGLWVYLVAAAIIVGISGITISAKIINAALRNPVDALYSE
jgi:putative ABC transport system permease protein